MVHPHTASPPPLPRVEFPQTIASLPKSKLTKPFFVWNVILIRLLSQSDMRPLHKHPHTILIPERTKTPLFKMATYLFVLLFILAFIKNTTLSGNPVINQLGQKVIENQAKTAHVTIAIKSELFDRKNSFICFVTQSCPSLTIFLKWHSHIGWSCIYFEPGIFGINFHMDSLFRICFIFQSVGTVNAHYKQRHCVAIYHTHTHTAVTFQIAQFEHRTKNKLPRSCTSKIKDNNEASN